jgi:GntR family transcriptional regulator
LIFSQRGKGTFVREHPLSERGTAMIDTALEQFSELAATHRIEIVKREPHVAPPMWDWRVGTPARDYMRIVKRHIDASGVPYAFFVMHVESALYGRLPPGGDARDKIIRLVRSHGKVRLSSGKERLTVGVAEMTEAEQLHCPAGLPVARIKRIFLDAKGIALFYGAITYRGDRLMLERDFASDSLRP